MPTYFEFCKAHNYHDQGFLFYIKSMIFQILEYSVIIVYDNYCQTINRFYFEQVRSRVSPGIYRAYTTICRL